MRPIVYIVLGVLVLVTLSYLVFARVRKVMAINKAFFSSGYFYVNVTTNVGRSHKGFITKASLRVFSQGESNTNLQIKFHRDGETLIVPMQSIRDIKVVRPPLF